MRSFNELEQMAQSQKIIDWANGKPQPKDFVEKSLEKLTGNKKPQYERLYILRQMAEGVVDILFYDLEGMDIPTNAGHFNPQFVSIPQVAAALVDTYRNQSAVENIVSGDPLAKAPQVLMLGPGREVAFYQGPDEGSKFKIILQFDRPGYMAEFIDPYNFDMVAQKINSLGYTNTRAASAAVRMALQSEGYLIYHYSPYVPESDPDKF